MIDCLVIDLAVEHTSMCINMCGACVLLYHNLNLCGVSVQPAIFRM